MAASSHSTEHVLEEAVRGEGHPTWTAHFSEETRDQLMHDDLMAGRTVPWLLTSLIFGGVILATTTVLLVWKVL